MLYLYILLSAMIYQTKGFNKFDISDQVYHIPNMYRSLITKQDSIGAAWCRETYWASIRYDVNFTIKTVESKYLRGNSKVSKLKLRSTCDSFLNVDKEQLPGEIIIPDVLLYSEPLRIIGQNRKLFSFCPPYFMGIKCQILIEPCDIATCYNQAKCIDQPSSDIEKQFICECANGYQGDFCEIDINECEGNPCQNKGECLNGRNSFYCICDYNFNGIVCERIISEETCHINPCDKGTCSIRDSKLMCSCEENYQGVFCDREIYSPHPSTLMNSFYDNCNWKYLISEDDDTFKNLIMGMTVFVVFVSTLFIGVFMVIKLSRERIANHIKNMETRCNKLNARLILVLNGMDEDDNKKIINEITTSKKSNVGSKHLSQNNLKIFSKHLKKIQSNN